MVEYILIVVMLLIATYGINKLFAKALKGYFNRIAQVRTGIAGMGP